MPVVRRKGDGVIAILHPGEMGAAVGRCLTDAGHLVLWASQGRGTATAARAESAGLADAGSIEDLAGRAEVIMSVCPPDAALEVSRAVAGFEGTYVDAAWTKGTAALLLAVRALARADGVEADLLAEWALSQPRRETGSARAAGSAGSKGWRWAGEMEEIAASMAEIAASMAESGLPGGFHQAAAEIFRRVPRLGPAATDEEALDAILTALGPTRADDRSPAPG